jgi:hypothetical protein
MNGARRTLPASLVAATLFLVCVALMVVMSRAKAPQAAQQQGPPGRENLDAPREVQGVPCSRYVELAPDGRLTACVLARDHAFGSIALPANTQLSLRPDGSPKNVHLGKDTVLDRHNCLGRGPGEWMTGFHPNGRLEYCFLIADETIDGVPCRHGSFWGEITGGVIVRFHDNGRLATCRLTADVTLAGQTVTKGKRIALDVEGNVVPVAPAAQ